MYRSLLPLLLAGALAGCGGWLHNYPAGRLGVPYYAQEQDNYCVPASIKMWRGYDGLNPTYSQDEIWMAIGGAPCSGSDAEAGVRQFTATGYDAYQDIESTTFHQDFMARQITSIDKEIPVMVVVHDARDHVGILNGGKYTSDSSTGRYRWEYVFFHDPDPYFGGSNRQYTSDDWIDLVCMSGVGFCAQIISQWATEGWSSSQQHWSSSIDTYQSSSPTQEYQN